MKFLVDENVRREIVAFLQEQGHDVLLPPPVSVDNEVALLAQQQKKFC